MGLKIFHYGSDPALSDAIARYQALLLMTFQTTLDRNIYKIFETPLSQVYRQMISVQSAVAGGGAPAPGGVNAVVDFTCPTCSTAHKLQAKLAPGQPLLAGTTATSPALSAVQRRISRQSRLRLRPRLAHRSSPRLDQRKLKAW